LPRPSDLELVEPLVQDAVADPWDSLCDWVAGCQKTEIVERARLLGLAVSAVGEATSPLQMPVPGQPQRPAAQPLVVDFSAMWAGPLCARLLRLAGARVVKVESRDRPDGARLGDPRFYELLNAGHESLVVDPQLPADRAALRELVGAADIVIEASRPRALAGWGLCAQEVASSGTVWLSITAYGRGQGDRIGFGDDVAAGAGLVEWTGSDGLKTPSFAGDAIADPLTGLAGAVAVLRACGRGQVIDLSMASAAATARRTVRARANGPGPDLVGEQRR
jgi:crotonobetainyl-CoA:carnitine CoA-transferase CaiB-like acyl-CoA transferase